MSPFFGLVASSSSGIIATGGTITTSGGYKIHTFTSTSNFVLTANPNNELFEIFALGGGGNGGGGGNIPAAPYTWAGVGGMPGAFAHKTFSINVGTHTVTIGGSNGGATSLGTVVNTGTTQSGTFGNYPDTSYIQNATYPLLGVARTQYGDYPFTSTSISNIVATSGGTYTTSISGSSVTYGGVGAAGSGGYSSSSATGTGGAAGSNATGYGAGGGGGAKPSSSGNTSGAAGSPGILIVRYRA